MPNFIKKTFGGLKTSYLIRQYLFGLIFAIPLLSIVIGGFKYPESIYAIIYIPILWILYPYSRFVYESVASYIMGDNILITDTSIFVVVKLMTMGMCFVFSIFIAPFGLLYLYFQMSKLEKQSKGNSEKG
ncbi:hypothetical protein [uncultured Gilliamella sp.]|jgi:hypothetical protein|uniref:hypothetical protein n=1 Tax=uncultured Gilliamella sp. TaxID=1193505 RepID=UPI0025FE0FF2|nr:hypothetical protein [uncultured Gilliamella sp.]